MSSNTNTLFWVITGAVIVLGIFALVNNSEEESLTAINGKYGSLFSETVSGKELGQYYGHESNYMQLKVTSESDFEFDESTGTITGYIGTNPNVVFPAYINGVAVKKIGYMELWNRSLYSQECEDFTSGNFDPNDEWVQHRLEMLEYEGVYKDGVCQKRILLESVVIPNTVEVIGNAAFLYNTHLKKVTLPSSIKRIEQQAFQSNQIESIKLDHLKDLTYIGSYAFSDNNISGEVVIPDSVTSMDYYAFGKNNITKAVVSKNLGLLPMFTFIENPNMESVIFRSNNMSIRELVNGIDKTFNQDANFEIYVPVGSKSWYQSFPALQNYRIIEANV